MKHTARKQKKRGAFGSFIALALVTGCLLGGCSDSVQSPDPSPSAEPTQGEEEIMADIIKDLYVDKARYDPGQKPVLTVEMESETAAQHELKVVVTHLTEPVFQASETVSLEAGTPLTTSLTLELPTKDFMGYAVEVYLMDGQTCIQREMTAAEVASDWSRFPRYGYLTKYGEQTDEQIQATLERLNKHHITGLFYYDVLNRHDLPLAGTVEDPDSGWKTLANHYASLSTVQRLIDYGHDYNMNSYMYNLVFGAYEGYGELGVDYKWGLYQNKGGQGQDAHGPFVDSWESKWLFLFDPANTQWQDYYLKVTADALAVFDYDGIQADSLGYRGKRYDYYGNEVDLAAAYVPLLNRLSEELDTRVIFNPVSGYGMSEMLESVEYDIVYEEVWPHDGATYSSLKNAVDYARNRMDDDKGIVIAAYMDYKKNDGVFGTAGVLLTNATLMASGASHLELGDTGMLKSEYYPGDTLRINSVLEKALRNYYSFSVAYENYLRNPEYVEVIQRTYINDKTAALDASKNRIWCFTKKNENGDQLVNFINLIGVSSLEWVDNYGKQEAPERQSNLTVKQYVQGNPSHIYLASPDLNEGIMTELEFEVGKDLGGTYVTFTMPELAYWNMIIIKQ